MPIMSFSASDGLKQLVHAFVDKKLFTNASRMIRVALLQFINTQGGSVEGEVDAIDYEVSGVIMITFKNDDDYGKKMKDVNDWEGKYKDLISSTSMMRGSSSTAFDCFLHGSVFDFRKAIDDLGSVEGVDQVRYIIN